MPSISNTSLSVDTVEGHPGLRRVRVAYDLAPEPAGHTSERVLVERVAVHAVDEHDAPTEPRRPPIVVFHRILAPGLESGRREFEETVRRIDLDVEQDWWSTDESGTTVPIAEWVDHLVADISLHDVGDAVAETSTEVVSGSWGALGSD